MAKQSDQKLAPETVHEFVRLMGQVMAFYEEISVLSKKSPDGAMNKFKLKFINAVLTKATALLGDKYRPFAEFEMFSEDEMPTTSDVGVMLSQYLNSMGQFKKSHTYYDSMDHEHLWRTTSSNAMRVDHEEL